MTCVVQSTGSLRSRSRCEPNPFAYCDEVCLDAVTSDEPIANRLAAALEREETLRCIVEEQRAEIDRLRSLVNSLQLHESLRLLSLEGKQPAIECPATPPPPAIWRQTNSALSESSDDAALHAAMKRLRVE